MTEKISVLCILPGNEMPERFTVGERPVFKGEWHGEAVVKDIKFFLASSHFVKFAPVQPVYVIEYENSNARTTIPATLLAGITTEKVVKAAAEAPALAMFDGEPAPVGANVPVEGA